MIRAMNEEETKPTPEEEETIPTPETQEEEAPQQEVDELTKWREMALRTAAEYDNYRKRCVKDREDFTKYANRSLLEELERRLRNRGTEADEVIQQRLFKASEELGFKSSYDYIVENNFVEQCAESIINIYENEK